MRLVFSCGGSGGHIFPALAVADEIKSRHPEAEFLFIGAQGKMEMERVPKAGYSIKGLWISGFLGKSIFSKLMTGVKLVHSLLKSYFILSRFKPGVAVGFGGFASGPALFAAAYKGIPTMIQEQNSHPGMTNRLLNKRVDKIAIAYEEATKTLSATKAILLGNPVRASLVTESISKTEACKFYGLDPKKKTVMLLGGSLGARTFNRSMRSLKEEIENCGSEVQFLWQMGKLYAEEYGQSDTAKINSVKALPFLERMDMAYAATDLVVARAGAISLSELALLAKATLLVPSPNVSEDHQTANAMALVNKGAAQVLKDDECETKLISTVLDLLDKPDKLEQMKQNIKKLATPHATKEIADEVVKLIKR